MESPLKELRIKDFQLKTELLPNAFRVHLPEITSLYSTESEEECKKLLRAVVNAYLKLKLHHEGVDQNRLRERKLIINYFSLPIWKWNLQLHEAAQAYQRFKNRPAHNAVIDINGQRLHFEARQS